MQKKRGFTLIELLVVVSIIALLVAILMPALGKAREQGKRAVCVSNQKSLGTTWVMYADDNGGLLVCASMNTITQVSTSPPTYRVELVYDDINRVSEKPWVGYYKMPASPSSIDNEAAKAAINLGALWKYCKSYDIYRCSTAALQEWRTYSIVDAMNGAKLFTVANGYNPPGIVFKRIDRIKRAAERLVFIDEGEYSVNSWTINPSIISWWDKIPVRHNKGCTFSFADGHADFWKWDDPKTIAWGTDPATSGYTAATAAADNEDFRKMQRACWGHFVGDIKK